MADSDNDIEFLDEDADIVQQCVQTVQYAPPVELKSIPLLVERQPAEKKRKRKKQKVVEDDSDYDPNQDFAPPSPPSPKVKKRRVQVINKKVKTFHKEVISKLNNNPNLKITKNVNYLHAKKETVLDRNECSIRIPDYDDPLCLPVKAIKQEESDIKRLNNWNNVCLEHFKHCDNLLKPERGETNSSTRTMVFRNVDNKQTGKVETTIWSKTCVENEDGDRKSEIFQCVLPRYKEKRVLTKFGLLNRKPKRYLIRDEVILSKEEHRGSEVLVAYKPKEKVSAVYKLITAQDRKDELEDKEDDEMKMYMKELLWCKMCAPCFQTSWRGVKRTDKKVTACPICNRSTFVTTYSLLSHFKSHTSKEMRKYKFVISNILAETVEYHYKCRLCRQQFNSIKDLRKHVTTHQGVDSFLCEVGNHVTK